ncbi:hypothetical protein [Sporosarcina sp. ACRSL]|uniref:hypothetical protein n=1 Tax=Sporosarcina sp. ACRSL TaxID=2918215 RepID=UPI001EF6EC5D|nr:hypothetical protein [Sporosarcina sp. ACRSL]
MELKADMNNSVFKDMEFGQKQRNNVLNKLDAKNKNPFNVKFILSSTFSVLIFCVLLLSTIQIKDGMLIGRDSGSQFYPLQLNEQLIADAKNGIFSPVPSVSYGMSVDEVRGILGEPNSVEMPSEIDTVLWYGDIYLLFTFDELLFTSISNIPHITKEDMIKVFGRPDYEAYNEEHGHGLVTFSVGDSIYKKWHFNCFVDIQDKNTITSIQFSKDVIRFGSPPQ